MEFDIKKWHDQRKRNNIESDVLGNASAMLRCNVCNKNEEDLTTQIVECAVAVSLAI